jgi:hypothetical protein
VSDLTQIRGVFRAVGDRYRAIIAIFSQTKNPNEESGQICRRMDYRLFGDFASLDAAGANPETFRLAINPGIDRLQINVEASVAEIVGLADIVSYARFLAAYFANLCHQILQIRFAIYRFIAGWQAL